MSDNIDDRMDLPSEKAAEQDAVQDQHTEMANAEESKNKVEIDFTDNQDIDNNVDADELEIEQNEQLEKLVEENQAQLDSELGQNNQVEEELDEEMNKSEVNVVEMAQVEAVIDPPGNEYEHRVDPYQPIEDIEQEEEQLESAHIPYTRESIDASDHIDHPAKKARIALESAASFPYQNVILDIEGTTTSISFVKETLFPYARQRLGSYIRENASRNEVVRQCLREIIRDLRTNRNNYEWIESIPETSEDEENNNNEGNDFEIWWNTIETHLLKLMDLDMKFPPLKQLQGLIWDDGYSRNELRSHVYDDILPAFRIWRRYGIPIYIYSSGSESAQRNLFKYTDLFGDLGTYISDYFDSGRVGRKTEVESYKKLASLAGGGNGIDPERSVFITDMLNEAVAAHDAGFQVLVSVRPGNLPVPEDFGFRLVASLMHAVPPLLVAASGRIAAPVPTAPAPAPTSNSSLP